MRVGIKGRRRSKNPEDMTCEEAERSQLLHVITTPTSLGLGTRDIANAKVCQTIVK
jgi:hypothetical protein